MADPVLDINDASLCLWRNPGETVYSPGYALLEGSEYRFGEAARDQARLHPRQIHHRYWSQLDTEPLKPAFGPCRHAADLVHAHLLSIHEAAGRPESLIIAAPGSLQHTQLSLLLGIVEQCPFTVSGLVDRALAATVLHPAAPYNWHIELQLNQALLTGIRCEDGRLVRDTVVPIPGNGWLAIQESLARAIADAFIRQTRFDPRRSAATEQALFDRLPDLLRQLRTTAEINLDLDGRQARIERPLLTEACDSHYQRILRAAAADNAGIVLGETLHDLPDVALRFPGARMSPAGTIYEGVEQHLDSVLADDKGVRFITSLPTREAAESPAAVVDLAQPTAARPAASQPAAPEPAEKSTGNAPEPAAPSRCLIDFKNGEIVIQPESGPALQINGQTLARAGTLNDGDLIELQDGSAWRLVAVRGTQEDGA